MNTDFLNLSDYPIDQPHSSAYQSLVGSCRETLSVSGMINLQNFVSAEGVRVYQQEIDSRMDIAFHAVSERHPYGYHRSDDFPEDHPRNRFASTQSHRLARHHLPDTDLDALYCWPPMRRFIADITSNEQIYLSADPSNGLVIQIYGEGHGQAWHFDQALFSTIINLGEPKGGGVFECVPNLRTEGDPNYDGVKNVLDGKSDDLQQHRVRAGSFTVMLGRYTMHRVTPVEEDQTRISAILSYELEPGVHMDLETRRISFGPTAPVIPDGAAS